VTLFSLSTSLLPLGAQRPLCLRGPPQAGSYRLAPLYPRSPVALAVHAFIRNFVAYILTRPLHLLIYTWCRAANHRRLLRDHHRAFKFIVTDFDFFGGFGEAEAPPPASA